MSLISAIYDAIFTETPSDVSVTERSFVSVMLDANNQKEAFGKDDFHFRLSKGKSLVLTRFLLQLVNKCILGVIWLIYGIYDVIHRMITGRWRGMKSSSGINLVIGSMILVITIMALLYILAFLTKEVVLSPNNARINDKGVITVDQPCLETHSFFLLNAANFWTSTGIQINKGDRVYITASGSMYSDISDMYKAAIENKTLKYARSILGSYKTVENDTVGVQYCIYGRYDMDGYYDCGFFKLPKCLRKHPRFGSLLYQIGSPHKGFIPYNDANNPRDIQQINLDRSNNEFVFDAQKSGVLYLTFNDILLDSKIFNKIHKDRDAILQNSLKTRKDTAALEICRDLERVHIDSVKDIEDEQIWFKDNLGEVLVNVRIEKSIRRSDLPWYKKPVVRIYRHLNHLFTRGVFGSAAWINILAVIAWLVFDIIFSNSNKRTVKNE